MLLHLGIFLLFNSIFIGGFLVQGFNTGMCSSEHNLTLKAGQSINISSPGFKDSLYPADSLCSWTVNSESGPNTRLLVEFLLISIWPSFNCLFDGLILFDGNSSSAPVIGKYCSGTPSFYVTSSGTSLHLIFYSSDVYLRQFKGFSLTVKELEPKVPCMEEEIMCHNKKCIAKQLICDKKDDCGDGTDEESCAYSILHTVPCGSTPISPSLGTEDRIVGGRRAIPGSWPWQCSLRRKGSFLYGHLCGAVLINDQWILTAAHCFRELQNSSQWSVHLGKFYKEKVELTEQVRYIKALYIHPQYNFERSNNVLAPSKDCDIALARLNAPTTMTKFVRPICLPPWRAKSAAGTLSYVTGWGETLGTGSYDVLKQAAVPIVSEESCFISYKKSFNVSESMVCAGYDVGGHDSCKGDSGGPLVAQKSDRWYLIGLVSTGSKCAAPMQPGIYTRVSVFKSWISTVMLINS